jgi:hypothetical protein
MRIIQRATVVSIPVVLLLLFGAGIARAQQPPPASQSGPLVLESMQNGFVLAPDVKFTKVNGQVATLAGAYGGWLQDDQMFIGGAAYWRVDAKHDINDLAYGGMVFGWNFDPKRPVSAGVKSLVGFGHFSQFDSSAYPVYCDPRHRSVCTAAPSPYGYGHYDYGYGFHSDFFLFEPEVDVHAKITSHVRVTAGASYLFTDSPHGLDDAIHGATGSVSVQFRLGK